MKPYISLLLVLLSISLVKAQENWNPSYLDFLYGKEKKDLGGVVTIEERDYVLFLIDSIPFYSDVFRSRMKNEPKNPAHALDYLVNFGTAGFLHLHLYDTEKAVSYFDSVRIEGRKIIENNNFNPDPKFQEIITTVVSIPLFKSGVYSLSGDAETALFYLDRLEYEMELYDLNPIFKFQFKQATQFLYASIYKFKKECQKSKVAAEKNLEYLENDQMKKAMMSDSSMIDDYYDNVFNAHQAMVVSLNCECDSLLQKGKLHQAAELFKNNQGDFSNYFKSYQEKKEYYQRKFTNYSLTSFGLLFYKLIGDELGAEKLFRESIRDNTKGTMGVICHRDYAKFQIDFNVNKAILHADSAMLLFHQKIGIDNDKAYKFNSLYISIIMVKALAVERKYFQSKDKEQLLLSFNLFKEVVEYSKKIRASQSSPLSGNTIEASIRDYFAKAALNAFYCHQAYGEEKYLHSVLNYTELGKSFHLNKNNESIQELGFRENENFSDIFSEDKKLANQIRYYEGVFSKSGEQNKRALDSLLFYRANYQEFLAKLKIRHPKYYYWKYDNPLISIKDLQKNLQENTAIFSYLVEPEISLLNIITKEKLVTLPIDSIQLWIDPLLKYNETVKEGGWKKYTKYGPLVSKYLIEKGISQLAPEIKQLIIIPDDELNELVFETLPIGKNSKYLIEDYSISYQYSIELLDLKPPVNNVLENKNKDLVAFNPYYEQVDTASSKLGNFRCTNSQLTFAAKMTEDLPTIFDEVQVIQRATRDDVFKNSLGGNILHFAAHGCVSGIEPPLNYKILLTQGEKEADGELSIADIYQLDLSAKLAVLAVCESGTGQLKRGVGLNSIARAFHFAGCPNTIATTAVVDEKSTSEILFSFYEYLKAGESIDVALQKAKIDYIRENGEEAEPYTWANIILIGNPTKISFD